MMSCMWVPACLCTAYPIPLDINSGSKGRVTEFKGTELNWNFVYNIHSLDIVLIVALLLHCNLFYMSIYLVTTCSVHTDKVHYAFSTILFVWFVDDIFFKQQKLQVKVSCGLCWFFLIHLTCRSVRISGTYLQTHSNLITALHFVHHR
jgi:hypothetical protein